MPIVFTDFIDSPLGRVVIAVSNEQLWALGFGDDHACLNRAVQRRHGGMQWAATPDPCGISGKLRAYFAGDLRAIDSIAIDPGGTPFQRAVWAAVRAVPPGTTLGYGTLAAQIGRPAAARAVGAANGANPIAIVVPCHRLVGADGTLVRYGGGLDRKRWLLQHEGASIAHKGP